MRTFIGHFEEGTPHVPTSQDKGALPTSIERDQLRRSRTDNGRRNGRDNGSVRTEEVREELLYCGAKLGMTTIRHQ